MPPNINSQYTPPTDPYAFLNEPSKKRSLINLFWNRNMSMRGRLIIITVVLVVLLIITFALKSVLTHPIVNLPSVYAVLSEQQELVNLATTGTQQSSNQSFLNFSYTAIATATTDQSTLFRLLAANNIAVNPNQYVIQPNAANELTQAEADSEFDSTYPNVMQAQLKLYQAVLNNAYMQNTSAVLKGYLKKDYQNCQLLIDMLNSNYA
jgi:predicted outer membrane protein